MILWNENISHRPPKKQAISELAQPQRSELKLMSISGCQNFKLWCSQEDSRRDVLQSIDFHNVAFHHWALQRT